MTNKMMPPFYMVLADNSHELRYRHGSFDLAQREARRLAGLNPGVKFFVLQCMGAAIARDPAEWIQADEIPF